MDDQRSPGTCGSIPAKLLVLERGRHASTDGGACAMEAASWLAGEPWSDRPASVHPRLAAVARATNDALDDLRRQSLWPLILQSVGTGAKRWRRPLRRRLMLNWQIRRVIRHARVKASDGEALRSLWETLLLEFEEDGGTDCGVVGTTAALDRAAFVNTSPRTEVDGRGETPGSQSIAGER